MSCGYITGTATRQNIPLFQIEIDLPIFRPFRDLNSERSLYRTRHILLNHLSKIKIFFSVPQEIFFRDLCFRYF